MTPGDRLKELSILSADEKAERGPDRRGNGNGSVRITARHVKGALALIGIIGGGVGLYGQAKDGWPIIPNGPRETLAVDRAIASSNELRVLRDEVDRIKRDQRKVLPYLDWLVTQEIRRQEREGRTVDPPRVE